ncbi:MAG: hypothetical protein LBS61_02685 [Endomicrobium sp.]|nr:hypothetical protein [Endomicrobium sp.]
MELVINAFADFLGIGRAWKNTKRETTDFVDRNKKPLAKIIQVAVAAAIVLL